MRAIRHRLRWRQEDLAGRAGVSQDMVSLIERGHIERARLATLRRVAHELDADLVLQVRWRGGDLDRLLDEGHAALIGQTTGLLKAMGWTVRPEVSYSVYGERGSIDLLAWHPSAQILLVVEVKTELVSVEATLRKHDEKARLAGRIAGDQLGWRTERVARLLVLPESSTTRRRVDRQAAVIDAAYPFRGIGIRQWLRNPREPIAGLLFTRFQDGGSRRAGVAIARKRIRHATAATRDRAD